MTKSVIRPFLNITPKIIIHNINTLRIYVLLWQNPVLNNPSKKGFGKWQRVWIWNQEKDIPGEKKIRLVRSKCNRRTKNECPSGEREWMG